MFDNSNAYYASLPIYTKRQANKVNLDYWVYNRQLENDSNNETDHTNKIVCAVKELYLNGQREIVVNISHSIKSILHSYIKNGSPYDSRVFGYLQQKIGEKIPELEFCQLEFEIDIPNSVSDRDVIIGGDDKSAFLFKGILCREEADYDIMIIRW